MKIISTGSYVPDKVVTNEEIEIRVDTTANWIESKLGIKERRIASYPSSVLAFRAAAKAINASKIDPILIDMLIVATSTPDKLSPSTAAIIQNGLGIYNAIAFDINAVCSGFVYAMAMAEAFKRSCHNILIVGVDTFSKITDWDSRDCVFFGDGAGAVLVRSTLDDLHYKLGTDGRGQQGFECDHGSTFKIKGKDVYSAGLKYLPMIIKDVLKKAELTIDDIDWMLPHQASILMLKELAQIIGIPFEKVLTNMDKYGNTAAASIPILLDENDFQTGDRLLMVAIGSGWTYGAIILEW